MRFVVLAKRCTLNCFAQIPAEISCAFFVCFVFFGRLNNRYDVLLNLPANGSVGATTYTEI